VKYRRTCFRSPLRGVGAAFAIACLVPGVLAALADKTVWDAEYDPSMINNPFARPETMKKVYNSFLP
jgi:hypothetical protein